ncbi:MAG: hypothetical protein SH859_14815 [Hyphomicrobium aestuarii]|nr:hypothetical protein [Hyphomicrobium aestuarii]
MKTYRHFLVNPLRRLAPLIACTALVAWLGTAAAQTPSATPRAQTVAPAQPTRAALPPATPHTMTPDDLALDCPRLTGRIQVRIRQLRGALSDERTTEVARSLQSVASPIFGGTSRGINPDADNARDLGIVVAYNQRLIEKKCPAYNLEAEFAPGNTAQPKAVKPAKPPTTAKPPAVPSTPASPLR